MPVIHIFAHGTSQDSNSTIETTVQLAEKLKAKGEKVYEVNGIGSPLRSLELIKNSQTITENYWESSPGVELVAQMAAGIMGVGLGSNIQEIVEIATSEIQKRACRIKLIGFSRGAVAIAHALNRICQNISADNPVIIEAAALDAVPGPGMYSQVRINKRVNKFLMFHSLHEGRIGFAPLDVIFESDETIRVLDSYIGPHSAIGGHGREYGCPQANLVMDRVIREMALGLPTLSEEALDDEVKKIVLNPTMTVMGYGSIFQHFAPRTDRIIGDITWNSNHDRQRLLGRHPELLAWINNPTPNAIRMNQIRENHYLSDFRKRLCEAASERGQIIQVSPAPVSVEPSTGSVVYPPCVRNVASQQGVRAWAALAQKFLRVLPK